MANGRELLDPGVGPSLSPHDQIKIQQLHQELGLPDLFDVNPQNESTYQDAARSDLHFRFSALEEADFNLNSGYVFRIVERIDGVDNLRKELLLPINPQNISINVPVASSVQVTMKGIVEDHNGAPLRQISISGTSGVMNKEFRQTDSTTSSAMQSTIDYAFRNTIQAATRLTSQLGKAVNAGDGTNKVTKVLNRDTAAYDTTGYRFIHRLTRFLDWYLALKKTKAGRHYRLMFYMIKDQQTYACMLNNYSTVKEQGTIETRYTINLTAWRRDSGRLSPLDQNYMSKRSDAGLNNYLSRAITSLRQARLTLARATDVLTGIRSDINESLITPLSECILFAKDFVSAANTLADFVSLKFLAEAVKQNIGASSSALSRAMSSTQNAATYYGGNQNSGTTPQAIKKTIDDFEQGGSNVSSVQQGDTADPFSNMFKDSFKNTEIFDDINVSDLELTPEAQQAIDDQISTITEFTVEDIKQRRDKLSNFSNSVSEALGGANATYNRVFGLQAPKKTFKTLSVDDLTLLSAMNDILIALDGTIARMEDTSSDTKETYYSYYADYAITAGLKFTTNQSKFFVPFPHGATLESIAVQYLGDVDRWMEIVALNGLKAPYIDEEGYFIQVTASSGGNTLTIGDASNLYVTQIVEIRANSQGTIKRKIRGIDIVSSAQTLVTFEPVSDNIMLSSYKPNDNAQIHAFLPNTVNSDMLIAIPSIATSPITTAFKTAPGVEDLDGLARLAKIDLLLDTEGDIIISTSGDVRLATGMTNLIQGAFIKLRTRAQTLLQYPQFGGGADPGTPTSEIDASKILAGIQGSFAQDSRYGAILASEINKVGGALSMSIIVQIPSTNINLPISVQLPLGT